MTLGNLSNLSSKLKEVESAHLTADRPDLSDVRLSLVNALEDFRRSRFRFGKTLSKYKTFFLASHGWLAAAKAIATTIGCDERTVRRIVEDYDRVSEVPTVVIEALEKAGIDPAARRNASIISKMLRMPHDSHGRDPESNMLNPTTSKTGNNQPSPQSITTPNLEFRSYSQGQKRHLAICNRLRSAVIKIQADQKLPELVSAIEEMYLEWGMTEPISVSISTKISRPKLAVNPIQDDAA